MTTQLSRKFFKRTIYKLKNNELEIEITYYLDNIYLFLI